MLKRRAGALIWKLCSRARARIFTFVSSPISGLSLSARETVDLETPASLAISAMVRTDLILIVPCFMQPIALYSRKIALSRGCSFGVLNIIDLSKTLTGHTEITEKTL